MALSKKNSNTSKAKQTDAATKNTKAPTPVVMEVPTVKVILRSKQTRSSCSTSLPSRVSCDDDDKKESRVGRDGFDYRSSVVCYDREEFYDREAFYDRGIVCYERGGVVCYDRSSVVCLDGEAFYKREAFYERGSVVLYDREMFYDTEVFYKREAFYDRSSVVFYDREAFYDQEVFYKREAFYDRSSVVCYDGKAFYKQVFYEREAFYRGSVVCYDREVFYKREAFYDRGSVVCYDREVFYDKGTCVASPTTPPNKTRFCGQIHDWKHLYLRFLRYDVP